MRKTVYFILLLGISGCKVFNPSLMLKTGKDYKYAQFGKDSTSLKEYQISPNDIIEFQLFSNDGFKLIDLTSPNNSLLTTRNTLNYLVENDGSIKLPVLNRISIKGLTIRQAEQMLEEKYSVFYNKPFVMLKVINKRVIIFPGEGGAGKVITLTNNNTTLIEALALAGGVSASGKAYKIRLIRGELKNPEVYMIDLSTIEGMKKADLIVQANDIIYIEPRLNISKTILNEITPVLTIVSSLLLFYSLIKTGTN